MNGWLNVDEAAARLAVSRRTIARWCARGKLRAIKVGPRRRGVWMIPAAAVDRVLLARAVHTQKKEGRASG